LSFLTLLDSATPSLVPNGGNVDGVDEKLDDLLPFLQGV
jgi:hypothetical protein